MAFALTIAKLEEALAKPGCAVCRLGRDAAERAIDAFLWEHVTDPVSRQPIMDAYGFCPEHTRMLVAIEMATSGPVLGVNIIYEHLARLVSRDLGNAAPGGAAGIGALWQRLGGPLRRKRRVLPAKGPCPACAGVAAADANYLTVLLELFEQDGASMREAYRQADGICLAHLRGALEEAGARYPGGTRWLVDETRARLEQHSVDMREYIRKNNWEYRDERITPDEATAWRRALTFFTGLARDKFTFVKDE